MRIPVSALAAESRALKSAGGTMAAQRTWYNSSKYGLTPAQTAGKPQGIQKGERFHDRSGRDGLHSIFKEGRFYRKLPENAVSDTEDEKKTFQDFEFSHEGLQSAVSWLNSQAEERFRTQDEEQTESRRR